MRTTLHRQITYLANRLLCTPNFNIEPNCSPISTLHCTRINNKHDLKENNDQSLNIKHLLDNAATFENDSTLDESEWSTSPYPKGAYNPRLQSNKSLKPKVDPRETTLILFPGEGSQYVGMGHNFLKFPGVKDIFGVANEILKYDILSLCLRGPKSKLDETKYAQVAVMVCSFAALEKLKEERPNSVDSCMATAGFGIGELTALTFAGSIPFERAVRLAQLRGEAMQVASEADTSCGMITVKYTAATRLHEVMTKAKEHAKTEGVDNPYCEVSHYLFPHCKVLAGHKQCLEFIRKNQTQFKLEKVRPLTINGAHHTKMMQPAAYTFRKYLMKSNIQEPAIAVHSSLDGRPYIDASQIVKTLPKQMMKPVKWEQVMHVLYERPVGHHFPTTFECGPGESLRKILLMVNAKASDFCVPLDVAGADRF